MDAQDNTCPVCHEIVSVFAIGQCDHPICYKCSTRMRVLCEQMYCAICRSDLPEVLFVKKQNKYANINRRSFIPHKRYKIFFQDFDCEETFKKLQENKCKICKDRPADKSFYALKDHMRREHTLFCCDLCMQHLKIFSFERKFYNRRDLAIHRRTGDEDDKSYKGHPLCRFCDERYMDNDELLRHLRKDHYFCHFCDEGSNEYYNDYQDLKEHFKTRHYLCEIDNCINVQFTNAFRSDIDLKAHVAKEHHQRMNKAQFKEARTLDVNFHLAPRVRGRARGITGLTSDDYEDVSSRGQGRGYRGRGGYRGGHDSARAREERMQLERAREASIQESLKATEKEMKEIERKRREAQEKEERRCEEERLKNEMESIERDFPSLTGASAASSIVPQTMTKVIKKQPKDNKYQSMSQRVTTPGRLNSTEYPSLSGTNTNHSSSSSQKVSKPSDRDSPVLNPVQTPAVAPSNIQTVPQSVLDSMKKHETSVSKRVPKNTSEDFPTLGGGAQRSKNDGSASLVSLGVWSAKSRKNEIQMDNNSSKVKTQSNVPTSLASLGLSLVDTPPYASLAGKRGAMGSAPASTKLVQKDNNVKSKNNNIKKEIAVIERDPPPKTRDKEVPVDTKGSDDVVSKKSKKKKKQKEQKNVELERPSSAGSGKEGKAKKSKSSDPVGKLFTEQSDRDSGIESSSGSVDSTTVATFNPEDLKKGPESAKAEETSTDSCQTTVTSTYVPGVSCNSAGINSSSLDCIAVGLLGASSGATSDLKVPVLDDFPALNTTSSLAPPPGFKPSVPPGFSGKSSGSHPPPGFSSFTVNQETKAKCSPLSSDYENFVFSKPTNFSERNKELVQNVSILLGSDKEKFNKFKSYSGSFRQGSLDAVGYYDSCQELLGQENFDIIIPELIALLPDIDKQQDLLKVHKESLREKSKSSVLKISGKNTKAPWNVGSEFKTCPTCRQVLLETDFDAHLSEHGGLSDFPTLVSRGHQPSFLGQGSWIKAK